MQVKTVRLLVLMIGGFGLILILTHFFAKGPIRVHIVGWICLIFSVSVFAAPLCILVITHPLVCFCFFLIGKQAQKKSQEKCWSTLYLDQYSITTTLQSVCF